MDGKIVCPDKKGRYQFNDLLLTPRQPCFMGFDLLQVNGKDLRRERLIDRKHELIRIVGNRLFP